MAAPHVTGLAALILAHHADFHGPYQARNAARVERLFQILKHSAQPLNLGNPNRVGAGLPDALKAFGLIPQTPLVAPALADDLLRQLLEMLRQSAIPVSVHTASGTGATLHDLKAVLRQSGLLAGDNGGEAPESGGRNGQTSLQELKATLHHVGLL
jgi:subtilisin family serine protease